MPERAKLLDALGGEAGCKRLSASFYARVGRDPVLNPLFPGKTLKCAIEEFAAFLIQFLGGDEDQTQRRWWLSLRESHARFQIQPSQRAAWLSHMAATLDELPIDAAARNALKAFFDHGASYVTGAENTRLQDGELAARWHTQRVLDDCIAAIAAGTDDQAIMLARQFTSRPSVFAGILTRMVRSQRPQLIAYVMECVERDHSLGTRYWAGWTLLHVASAAGSLELVELLIRQSVNPDIQDSGRHTPLYSVANGCSLPSGPAIVQALVRAGADVNASDGVTRATPLHMAARRGHTEIARALLDCGAAIAALDSKGCTPLQRAINCRKEPVAQLLRSR